jgi:hypothetical protein
LAKTETFINQRQERESSLQASRTGMGMELLELQKTCLVMEWATPLASLLTQLKLQDKNKLLKLY